jgi:hypothetical protein
MAFISYVIMPLVGGATSAERPVKYGCGKYDHEKFPWLNGVFSWDKTKFLASEKYPSMANNRRSP